MDSKIGWKLSFLKQALIYTLVLIENSIESLNGTTDKKLFLVSIITGMLVIDRSEFYYSRKFKTILTTFDKILLVFSVFILVEGQIPSVSSYVFYSVALTVLIFISFIKTRLSFDKVLNVPLRNLEAQDDQ